jgi:crotonobetainyl-CoA hydratase
MSVLYEVTDHVARVTLNRPEAMNAVDRATEAELQRIWSAIEADRDVRAVVLTGAGTRAFCAGADVKDSDNVTGLEYWAAPRPGGFGGIALRTTLDVPVIARVNGHALGGGFEMVLGCDLIVAAENASFGLPEPRLGRLPLDGGMALLQRQIPFRHAMGMMLTGRRITAAEALRCDLVNEVAPQDGLDAAVDRWLEGILACAPLSIRAIKQSVRRTAHLTAQEAQAARLPALIEALQSKDQDEGVRAFVEKRKPVWRGE